MTKQGEVRDWNKDMELCEKATENKLFWYRMSNDQPQMSIYWLQQYAAEKQRADIAELAYQGLSEVTVSRGEYESLLTKHTAMTKAYWGEKERADKSEKELARNVDLLEKWNDQLTEYESQIREMKAREKKLREAIEAAINENHLWQNAGNALEVIERHLKDTLASLYPKEEVK